MHAWKGYKCEFCKRDLGCPCCGAPYEDLSMVSEEYIDDTGDKVTVYFCRASCRDAWKEKRKEYERRTRI